MLLIRKMNSVKANFPLTLLKFYFYRKLDWSIMKANPLLLSPHFHINSSHCIIPTYSNSLVFHPKKATAKKRSSRNYDKTQSAHANTSPSTKHFEPLIKLRESKWSIRACITRRSRKKREPKESLYLIGAPSPINTHLIIDSPRLSRFNKKK